jgi:hypothetical protein
MTDIDAITHARHALLRAASDARAKLLHFDEPLITLSAALSEIQRRQEGMQTQIDRLLLLPVNVHHQACECRDCSLVRATNGAHLPTVRLPP